MFHLTTVVLVRAAKNLLPELRLFLPATRLHFYLKNNQQKDTIAHYHIPYVFASSPTHQLVRHPGLAAPGCPPSSQYMAEMHLMKGDIRGSARGPPNS
ncbi:hypothetical protein INR49_026846 [Caranx melampygus]|nr:hypothetical protein INR49_026846 [Caranx melampygus]